VVISIAARDRAGKFHEPFITARQELMLDRGVERLIFAADAADTRRVTDITPTNDDRLLEELEQEERLLSAQRRRLQDRIDLLPGAATGSGAADEAQVRTLREQERDVSERRRAVHDRIELLRAQRDDGGDDRSAA
jgi:hypothetical protein